MKITILTVLSVIITQLLANPVDSRYNVQQLSLEVPSDPSKWVFKGNNSASGSGRGGRISNGNQAYDTQFPWVAEMSINLNNGGLLCTASLISDKWVLGARHCIADTNAVSLQVSMGSADRESPNRVKIFSDLFVWLNAVGGDEHPDIALFRLSQTVTFNAYVNKIRLPAWFHRTWTFEGFDLTAIGWGGVGGGAFSRYLQWTVFKVLPLSECNLGPFLCSQPPTGISSLEGGDSGGPSVIYEVDWAPTIIGLNNRIFSSGNSKWQGHTKVFEFLEFISDVTGIPIRYY